MLQKLVSNKVTKLTEGLRLGNFEQAAVLEFHTRKIRDIKDQELQCQLYLHYNLPLCLQVTESMHPLVVFSR